MPKVTVDKITIERLGDRVIVHAGAKPEFFSTPEDAITYAREALGIEQPRRYMTWDEAFITGLDRHINPPVVVKGMSHVDIVNAALKKMGGAGRDKTDAEVKREKRNAAARAKRAAAKKPRKK